MSVPPEVAARVAELNREMGRHGSLASFSPVICRSKCPEGWPCAAWKAAAHEFDALISANHPHHLGG